MNHSVLKIAVAQTNFLLGNMRYNAEKIITLSQEAHDKHNADVIVFPELSLTGYPPEDLLHRRKFHEQVEKALKLVKQQVKDIYVLIGYPSKKEGKLYNSACVIYNGKIIAHYNKQLLPNYSVFDEKRYFKKGTSPCLFALKNKAIGVVICEDLWYSGGPMKQCVDAGAQLILSLNASPFHRNKPSHRIDVMRERVQESHVPLVYVNCVGGQDELIFDGGSFVLNAEGEVMHQAPLYQESLSIIEFELNDSISCKKGDIEILPEETASIYQSLVMGTRDYLEKNHFDGAIVGLSGGIDSALTLSIVVDAIGADKVEAFMLPSRYTSQISLDDAKKLAENLKVRYQEISIEPMFESCLAAVKQHTAEPLSLTQENIQARCRGLLLMALSNQTRKMVIVTGNKSEMAMGYSTLYGDMAGGFAILKDVMKTTVYQLARYRNARSEVIPERTITRAPTAELRTGQLDTDSLPEYDVLDAILDLYVEQEIGIEATIEKGFDRELVERIVKQIDANEYKRRQSPPGIRISTRAFGRDWRYPISSHFNPTEKF